MENNTIQFKKGNNTLLEFDYNLSSDSLNLAGLTIKKQTNTSTVGSILIKGLNLANQNKTKTVYLDDLSETFNRVCILDEEIASISEISENCNQENETLIPCNGTDQSGYTCTDLGDVYKITGLKHSGVKEGTCTESWTCTDWSSCSGKIQTRTCTDNNNCGTDDDKPDESKSCSSGGSSSGGSSSSYVVSQDNESSTSNQTTNDSTEEIKTSPLKTNVTTTKLDQTKQVVSNPPLVDSKTDATTPENETFSQPITGAVVGSPGIKDSFFIIPIILLSIALVISLIYRHKEKENSKVKDQK